jgi:hypothetical protein
MQTRRSPVDPKSYDSVLRVPFGPSTSRSPDASRIVFTTTRNGSGTSLKNQRAEPGQNSRSW